MSQHIFIPSLKVQSIWGLLPLWCEVSSEVIFSMLPAFALACHPPTAYLQKRLKRSCQRRLMHACLSLLVTAIFLKDARPTDSRSDVTRKTEKCEVFIKSRSNRTWCWTRMVKKKWWSEAFHRGRTGKALSWFKKKKYTVWMLVWMVVCLYYALRLTGD